MVIQVRKASREQKSLKIALAGPSGSGKTYSALLMAKGLGGKILFLDTENRSADLYSDLVDFEKIDLDAPFTVEKYLEVIKYAEDNNYGCLVIDSLSHVWAGEGGLLEQKQMLDLKPGSNQYTNWAKPTAEHERLKSAIVQSNIHIIGCMRAKQEHILVDNGGKLKPQKVGMAAIQREGFEYEFDVMFMIDMEHNAGVQSGKDRTRLFEGKYFKLSEQTGKDLIAWTKSGAVHVDTPDEVKRKLLSKSKELGIVYDVEHMKALTVEQQIAEMNIKIKEATK